MNVFDYFFENTYNLKKDLILGNKELVTYHTIYENSLKIASYLYKEVGHDQNIILICPNSVFFITAYLGILKSGNTCVPLNFAIEQDNLDFIVETTKSNFAFIGNKLTSKLALADLNVIDEDVFDTILKEQHSTKFTEQFDHSKTAEIIFTSGSTGIPKGVMISHKNIMANTSSIIEYLKLTADDIMCVVLPFYYCYGLSLLHTHLRVGGSLVLNNTFIFLGTVINDIKNYKCTGFAGVPSHFQILLKQSQTFKETTFSHLRYVTQAGGKLHNVFIEEFVDAFPELDFYVMYGQTEATARLSYLAPDKTIAKLGSIGKAIPGVQLKVVDEQGIEVPSHTEGQLIAKGENVMLGYYKEPDETALTIKNGWLYTGVIAKRDEDGYLYLVARIKEIIKVGGKRVSPKEIEDVILKVPGIVDCSIIGVEDDILGEALKALIIVNQSQDIDEIKQAILNRCKEKLALYKIPQLFNFDTKMNVKSTGKKQIPKN